MRARALELAHGGLAAIEASRARVDDLNVFPVPDGDTGTNLTLTVRAIVEALAADGPDDRPSLAREATRAALLGARGNSGVIFSQIVRGAADALVTSDEPARVLRSASDAAYARMKDPVEGTMLTAIRELAEAAEAGADLPGLVRAGEQSVARTPELLAVLREAGVVDAGAAGLVEIVRGVVAVLTGEPLPEAPLARVEIGVAAIHLAPSRYRYCTTLVVEGEGLDPDAIEAELVPLGDSLLVVGDASALKVHVHVDDPEPVLAIARARGAVSGVEIADMRVQAAEREVRLEQARAGDATAVVAVAAGDGNRALFADAGALVVDGGRTMNPSTADILAAIEAAAAPAVVVLPNSPNARLVAEDAARSASKPAWVVPTTSLQAGLAALVPFLPDSDLEQNAREMWAAAQAVAVGAVTLATRDACLDGVDVCDGDWIGLVAGELVGAGEFTDVTRTVVARLLDEPRELLTLLTGETPPPVDGLVAELASSHPDLELELHEGGQPSYALLLWAE